MGANRGTGRDDELVNRLAALGFTRYEALAYLVLLDEHPATAYEVSKRGALTKGNVYTALESLVRSGAVQPVARDPVRYAPLDPRVVFGRIAQDTTAACETLAERLASRRRQASTDYVWTIAGSDRVTDRLARMIAGASRQIWIKGAHHLVAPHADALRAAAASGIAVLVVLFGTRDDAERLGLAEPARVYLHEGTGEMLAVGRRQLVLAVDFAETLIADFGDAPQAAYTRNPPVVFLAETMIRHEVYLAEIVDAFGPSIERRFGRDLITLRERYLPPELFRAVRRRAAARPARVPSGQARRARATGAAVDVPMPGRSRRKRREETT